MFIITMILILIGLSTVLHLLTKCLMLLDNKKLKDQTDFITRLNNGEVLNKDNIF